tara:strand:- start:214 stop:399 length:186 start_codon:yes stop_codon:yes gene_type:complete
MPVGVLSPAKGLDIEGISKDLNEEAMLAEGTSVLLCGKAEGLDFTTAVPSWRIPIELLIDY